MGIEEYVETNEKLDEHKYREYIRKRTKDTFKKSEGRQKRRGKRNTKKDLKAVLAPLRLEENNPDNNKVMWESRQELMFERKRQQQLQVLLLC